MLYEDIQKLFKIMIPCGKYQYHGLPMGIPIAPDLFQDKMSKLFLYMVHILVYMDDLVIIRNDMFKNHMYILDEILN